MANAVLPPTIPGNEEDEYNPASDLARAEATPAPLLSDSEKERLRDIHTADQIDGAENDPTRSVRDGEKNGGNAMNYEKSDRGGKNKPSIQDVAKIAGAAENPLTALNAIRKGGPIGLIIAIVLGVSALMFGSFSLLPVHIYQSFLSKYDNGTTSYTTRTDRVIASKLSNKATTATCDVTSILCRFSRPSNYMLKQMAANGITPLDSEGKPIEKTSIWPNTRPSTLEFSDSSGNKLSVAASDVRTTLAENPEFRAAYHGALKTRLQTFSDSIFKGVATKFGFTKKDTVSTASNEAEVNDSLNDEAAGTDADSTSSDGTTHVSTTDDAAGTAAIEENLTTKADSILKKMLAGSSVGGAVQLASGFVCALGDVPGIVISTARLYQMGQLVRFGIGFMRTINAEIAGTATQQEVSALGNNLTAVVAGQTALSSFGMRSLLYGDTNSGSDKTYSRFIPGGAAKQSLLGSIQTVSSSTAKKDICAGAASPVTGLAIDAALAGGTLGVGEVVNAVVGEGAAIALATLGPPLIKQVVSLVPASVYASLLAGAFGNITKDPTSGKNVVGEAYGNLAVSSSANTFGQLDNAGGNQPLTKADAVAYRQTADAVNLAYAQEDQATLSPLDASSNNTMMGSLYNSLIPLYSSMGSLTSFMGSFGSIASSSLSGIITGNSFAATNDTSETSGCPDDVVDNSIAAGPFCNIVYGIPNQYLDMDPVAVATDLVNGGQIDKTTGEAVETAPVFEFTSTVASTLGIPEGSKITSYYTWLQTCTDGSAELAQGCEITDKQTAEYAIYTIDHRVQKNIDNEDDTSDSSTTASGTVTNTGTKQQLAKAILDSGKVTFLEGNGSTAAYRKEIFSDIANGTSDGNSLSCGLNIKVLQLIKTVVDNHSSVGIGDTNRICFPNTNGIANSRHRTGNGSAVDFNSIDGATLDGYNDASLKFLKEIQPLLQQGNSLTTESEVGQSNCRLQYDNGLVLDLGSVNQLPDGCTHVHISYPVTDDPNLAHQSGAY